MKVTYDKGVDVAYISITGETGRGNVAHTYPCNPPEIWGYMINLDFDAGQRLLGIEILGASSVLPAEVLRRLGGA